MNPLDASKIVAARDRLASGRLVAVPTETVYGLAALASSEAALRLLFATKGRPLFDPLIVHVAGIGQAAKLSSDWNSLADFLGRWFWPGPLTIVVKKAPAVSPLITAGLDTVAIRWSSHPLLNDLLRLLGEPVAAPSANRFGKTSPSRAEHVRQEFPMDDLLILDGGPCEIGVESTVISASTSADGAGLVEILRPGAISKADLEVSLTRLSRPTSVRTRDDSTATPGSLPHHYMPEVPLALAAAGATARDVAERAAGLGLRPKRLTELTLSSDPTLAARELYAEMRRLSASGADLLWSREASEPRAREKSESGLWAAIRDRLTRAATYDWRA